MIEIDFTKYKNSLKIKQKDKKRFIFDPIRKKDLVLTPEEFVRQLFVLYLIDSKNYNKNRIAVEKLIVVNELRKRGDIIIYDKAMNPFLLVECKAAYVPINEKTFKQIAWYNMPLKVKYLVVTNGLSTYCCSMDYENETYNFLQEIPIFENA